jgi:hypothetical protein
MTISICLLKLEKEQRLEIRSAHIQITLGTPNNARMSILYVASNKMLALTMIQGNLIYTQLN